MGLSAEPPLDMSNFLLLDVLGFGCFLKLRLGNWREKRSVVEVPMKLHIREHSPHLQVEWGLQLSPFRGLLLVVNPLAGII